MLKIALKPSRASDAFFQQDEIMKTQASRKSDLLNNPIRSFPFKILRASPKLLAQQGRWTNSVRRDSSFPGSTDADEEIFWSHHANNLLRQSFRLCVFRMVPSEAR